jgi:2-hydroxy-6-oxonona-2,4-dienedioate hydrolase
VDSLPKSPAVLPAPVAALATIARRYETPCGAGSMVWRAWGAGVPVVLLHGGYGSWAHWLRNIGPLAEHYRPIAPDLPGLGDSAMPPAPDNLDDIVRIVGDGMATVLAPDERFHLVAFSFGGQLAGALALRFGDRIRSLTLVGAGGLGLPRGKRTELRRVERGMNPAEIEALQRDNVGKLMIHDPAAIDDVAVWLQIRNVAAGRFKSIPFAPGDRLARALPNIFAPLAGIWGEFDITALPFTDQRRDLLRAIQPASPFHIVAGAGHWVQYEAAPEFNRFLLDFLARH